MKKRIPTPEEIRSCRCKEPFATRKRARRMLIDMQQRHVLGGRDLEIYRCQFGKHYHIGHRGRRFELDGTYVERSLPVSKRARRSLAD